MKRVGKKKERIRSKRRLKWHSNTPIKVYFEGRTVPVWEFLVNGVKVVEGEEKIWG